MEEQPSEWVPLTTVLRDVSWYGRLRVLARLARGKRDFVLLVPPTPEQQAASRRQDAEDRRYGDVHAEPRETPYTCPCCGQATLPSRGSYDWCDECGWEDDGQDDHDSHVVRRRGPNGISLDEARARYVASGRVRGDHVPPGPPEGGTA